MSKLKKAVSAVFAAIMAAALNVSAFAAGLEDSPAVTGTTKLFQDISNVLLVVAPLVGTVCIIYFAIMHSAADEMDQKKWKQRIVVAVVSVVVAVLASALMSTLLGYYQ